MNIRVCVDPHEWPGREILHITAQVENILGANENCILLNQIISYQGNRFRIVSDTRYPQADSRVIGIRYID